MRKAKTSNQSAPIELKERRSADYKILEALKPFRPSNHDGNNTCGNITSYLGEDSDVPSERFYNRVSTPYLLARLCAGFDGLKVQVSGQEAYKITWFIALEHVETGAIVTLYDYKGAASIGSDDKALALCKSNKKFLKQLKALLDALCNDRFPHPYDGCVVGEVA